MRKDRQDFAPEGVENELKRLHYDTANATHPASMAALLKLVPADTPAFVTVRVADLMRSALGKKVLPDVRQGFAGPLEGLEKELGVPLAGIERLTVLVPFGPDVFNAR